MWRSVRPGKPDVCMLSPALCNRWMPHWIPQSLVVSRKMVATISHGCCSVWQRVASRVAAHPLKYLPGSWRDSSFGHKDPEDHWDLGCFRCHMEVQVHSQKGPEKGMAPMVRTITWYILICMGLCCLVCNDTLALWDYWDLKPITSRWPSPGEEQNYHEPV